MSGRKVFPKSYAPRQGERKGDRWGPCKECGYPGPYRCHACEAWRCRECIHLRPAPRRIGVYLARCFPKCRKRMLPAVAARVRRVTRVVRGAESPGEFEL